VALAALSSLSACSMVDSLFGPAPEAASKPSAAETPPAPPVARPPGAAPLRTARLPMPPAPAPGREADIEIKLVGLSRPETQALLGPPTAESERSPAKVWQYLSGDCAVDVYFYLDVARNEFYALHYEARAPLASAGGPLNGAPAAEWCLRRVHDAHRSR
jgi:hypothetical protein